MHTPDYDIAIIGGGIVGLATALALTRRGHTSLIVLEAEGAVAAHQSSHNSGVIHSGLYYKPGSLKAQLCVSGREEMYRFCAEHGLPHERCGKLVVATEERELPALAELERRGQANGLLGIKRLGPGEMKEHEPHVAGIAALLVPETGIADYRRVAETYARLTVEAGGVVETAARVQGCQCYPDRLVLQTSHGAVACRGLIACAGLQCDRVARLCGVEPGLQVVPFRGEYYDLTPQRAYLVRNLIYPVPDPRFPFLGVHFTRRAVGGIEAGPNAVLALSRAGYSWENFSLRDVLELAAFPGFWRMAWRYRMTGLHEVHRSLSKRAFLHALQRLIPELRDEDIQPAGAGVRAQTLTPAGTLVDDFHIVTGERMLHVLNAPSPAATASLSIGRMIAEKAEKHLGL
jgi:L-2-hydroxyglutarate oxidase